MRNREDVAQHHEYTLVESVQKVSNQEKAQSRALSDQVVEK